MLCKYCGKLMDEDSIFCGHCGKKNTSGGSDSSSAEIGNAHKPWLQHPASGEIPPLDVSIPPMLCEYCGSLLDEGGVFCGSCGKMISAPDQDNCEAAPEKEPMPWLTAFESDEPAGQRPADSSMFCGHCGSPLDIGVIFCDSCGEMVSSYDNGDDGAIAKTAQTPPKKSAEHKTPKMTSGYNKPDGCAGDISKKGVKTDKSGLPATKRRVFSSRNIIITIALTALLLCGVAAGFLLNGGINDADATPTNDTNHSKVSAGNTNDGEKTSDPPTAFPTATTSPTATVSPSPTPEPVVFDMAELTAIIAQMTSESNIAVAVANLNTSEIYMSDNADTQFVAAGFYVPVYLAYYKSGEITSAMSTKAGAMMSSMDNQAANEIISHLGGLQSLNGILHENSYAKTEFNRNFGDVAASNRGRENYTSAKDAVLLLKQLYNDGGYLDMNVNLESDGITLPDGVSYYAHRGQGIGTSFNVFAIATTPRSSYAIAAMTKETGSTSVTVKANATAIISEVLANVQQQMEKISEGS